VVIIWLLGASGRCLLDWVELECRKSSLFWILSFSAGPKGVANRQAAKPLDLQLMSQYRSFNRNSPEILGVKKG
jgi:hypothetical protein